MVNALSVPIFIGQNKYLKRPKWSVTWSLLFMKWRTGHSIFGQQNAPTAQDIMSGGSCFLPFLSLHNRQHLVQLKSSLLDHLTLWPVCSKLKQMAPPEHCQKILFGSNAHLRNNIKIYLRLNSTVCLWTMLNAGSSVTAVARSLRISRQSVYRIKAEVETA